jgi:hypothetical protein
LCDKRSGSGVAKCSLASQGNNYNENDSPFAVNHAPSFTILSTTGNNKNPGGTFTIAASSTDTDTLGTADTVDLFVCATNSASPSGCIGAGNTLCSALASVSNPSCNYIDTAPTPAGPTTYYGFIFDSHDMAATSNSRNSTYTINNVAPVIGSVTLNGGANIDLNIKGAGDKQVSVYLDTISDNNGCTDFDSASAVAYYSPMGDACSANYNNCYLISNASCTRSGCTGDDDVDASYTCLANMKYFAIPTSAADENNPYKNDNWLSKLTVYDGSNYAYATSPGVDVNINVALDVLEGGITFGSYFVGENTGTSTKTTSIENIGNSPIDTNISGTHMTAGGDTIFAQNEEWSLTQNFNYTTGNDLTIAGQDVDTDTPRPTAVGNSLDYVYWGIGIPYDVTANAYSGENTFSIIPAAIGW